MRNTNPVLRGAHVINYGPMREHIGGLGNPVVTGAPAFLKGSDLNRIKLLRDIANEWAMDPRLRAKAAHIVRGMGVSQRDYPMQARALLAWVQQNIYYTHEAGEQIQTPARTLEWETGDCDDSALLLATLAQSIGIACRYVLAGRTRQGKMVRWIEGQGTPPRAEYFHIYCQLGWPFGNPKHWMSAEPTLTDAPLGYDLVHNGVKVDNHGRPSVPPPGWNPKGGQVPGGAAPAFYGAVGAGGGRDGIHPHPPDDPGFFTRPYLKKLSLTAVEAILIAAAVAVGTRYLGVK